MYTSRKKAFAAMLLGLVVVVPGAAAEVLPWDEVQAQVFVTRRHTFALTGLEYVGVWTFDPDSGTYQRLVPFEFAPGEEGVGAHLAATTPC